MTGDQSDMVSRLKAVLPPAWFPDTTPVLDSLLSGLGSVWSWVYSLIAFVGQQTRIATASGVWLDMIANDLFGQSLQRNQGETDNTFRIRIGQEITRTRGTRAAIIATLTDLTGRTPTVFEPARSADTGGWGSQSGGFYGFAYGGAGGWGNLDMPFQALVTAYRPAGTGIADVSGWGGPGGYGVGPIEYGDEAIIEGSVTDADIYAAVAAVLPTTAIAWTQISN